METTAQMSTVLTRICALKGHYAQLPFFAFLRDDRRDAAERLAFYPCMAHFILSFGDLNTYVLRQEPAPDAHQARVNVHTYEDDHHWPWYLEDFRKLGYDTPTTPTAVMEFLWSDATRQTRLLMYRLTAMIERASSVERLAIVEAIEATGQVLFTAVLGLAKPLEARLGVELRYCGLHHFTLESGHAIGADQRELGGIELDPDTHARCVRAVEDVFALFTQWTQELLRFAQRHSA
jgi:hypothetical protein